MSGVHSFASGSGQFVVHGSFAPLRRTSETNNPALMLLEPQWLVIAAERTKRTICTELGIPDDFRDRVHITVLDRADVGQDIALITQVHSDRFFYKVGIPGVVEKTKMAKALVQVLLTEFANRSGKRSCQIPTWLVEGMTRQTFTSILPAYVTSRRPLTVESLGYDRLGESRAFLQTNSPLSIQELSFSNLSQLSTNELLRFEASAHLFVHRLLRLPNGPRLMAQFLQTLPHTLNWQTAFFAVYKDQLDTPLKLEKWWMLNWLEFKNRQEPEHWPLEVALQRLDAFLLTPMEVRTDNDSLPQHRETPLQEFLKIADFGIQRDLLSRKLQHMVFSSVHVPTDALPVWSGYQRAIETYLQKRTVNEYQPGLKIDPEQRLQALIKSTLADLDTLDQARRDLAEGKTPVLPKDLARAGGR